METITLEERQATLLSEPKEPLYLEAKLLEILMKRWSLNNTKASKILGVEPWSVGAWLSGKREISSKYKEKIQELLKIPLDEDLLIASAVNDLRDKIYSNVFDESDTQKLKNALVTIMDAIQRRLSDFKISAIDKEMLASLKKILYIYDDNSLANLNQIVTAELAERIYITSLSGKEYAEKILGFFEIKGPCDYSISYEFGRIIIWHYVQFYDSRTERLPLAKDIDFSYADELIKALKEDAIAISDEIFKDTAFKREKINDELIDNHTYRIGYEIEETNSRFKESMQLVMNRLDFHPDFLPKT